MTGFNFLLCDPVMERRIRLKQIAASVQDFAEMQQAQTTEAALKILRGTFPLDVVFVGGDIPLEEFSGFVKEAKTTPQGKDCAYVIVLKSQVAKKSERAPLMMAGADSILCEPFSVDQLVEITNVASRLRKERAEDRAKQAVTLILNDSIPTLDTVALMKSMGCEPGVSIRELHELGERIHQISPELLNLYFEMMAERFEKLTPPPEKPVTRLYKGASSRVKRLMERRIRAELNGRAR